MNVQEQKKRWLIFAITMLGTFMATLDGGIVNVALPVIAAELHIDLVVAQWVVSSYLVTITSLLPLFGKAGDIFGRRPVYVAGLLLFTAGSLFCGWAATIQLLIAARVVQAIGASMLMANSPAIISIIFPGAERGRAFGMIGSVVALGSMAGPSLGGVLVGYFSWQAIFYVNLPIGLAAALLGYWILPREQRRAETLDLTGAALFAGGMISALLALSQGHEWGWTSLRISALAVVAVLLLAVFLVYERRITHPMLDLSLFQSWLFLSGSIAGLLTFMAMFINNILLPFYLHTALSLPPEQIGLLITPFPLCMAVTAPVSGYLSERFGPVGLSTSGLLIMAGGMALLARLGLHPAFWQVATAQAMIGIGNGMFQSPNNNSVLSSIPAAKVGLASGISALVRNIGMVSGIALAVAVFEARRQQRLAAFNEPTAAQQMAVFVSAYQDALLLGVALLLAGATLVFWRRRALPQIGH